MKSAHIYYWTVFILIFSTCVEGTRVLKTEYVELASPEQIVALEDTLVRPVLYQNLPNYADLPVEDSKQKFIATILPAILIARYHLENERDSIKLLLIKKKWTTQDSLYYQKQFERYKAKDAENLLLRMKTHPNSITIAQAAVESGWGSSRFFREANNLFGIWSYRSDEQRIAADGNNVYLRKYNDVSQSIEDYFVTIGRARPYRSFRKTNANSDNIDELLPHLKPYSERGMDYVYQLKTIIRQNNLTQYDNYQIDPQYFVEK
ncbi:hypothetical protein E1176_12245 [Fulvivirga sp. RKSG066]|uniref:glucosaminidase domain-containing protein n=1 Tax=Fulvivirga aurantia TaxID=2529383 RepID=UPI0012BCA3CA|nr:glucosaminidase domain-containing protein [Fulvivirga aurantia]MTI21793.1 hypothetical protein [Fulvivirga aurantia]